jgi:hypothetical protein
MSITKKLSVALGLREKTEKNFANMLSDMMQKFTKKQGIFIGFRNLFTAEEGFADDPTQRKNQHVSSTVSEQLDWFKEHSKDYFKTVLSIEKTNAMGVKGRLVVDGEDWGEYTTLELLRLKSIMDGKIRAMIQELPIRPDGERWKKSEDPEYVGREVYEAPVDEGYTKTTLKRTVIVEDPHIKDAPNRPPVTQSIDTQVNTGKYSRQNFSGAISNRERAEGEVAFDALYKGIIAALEDANNTELQESDLGDKVLGYLF